MPLKLNLKKWNYETHSYDVYPIPTEHIGGIILNTYNMLLPIACTGCFKTVLFGDCFTSRTIHNDVGFGFPICEDCHEAEIAEERKYKGGHNAIR